MTRDDIMDALSAANKEFKYVADQRESWDVTPRGDCEDYAFWALRKLASGKLSFAWLILTGPWKFWYVEVPGPNGGHFMVEYTRTGEVFDNNYGRLVSKSRPVALGWRFVRTYSKLRTLLKIAFT